VIFFLSLILRTDFWQFIILEQIHQRRGNCFEKTMEKYLRNFGINLIRGKLTCDFLFFFLFGDDEVI
jgi:hypothetical protein